jgi:N-acetylmuramoyl-L-alanine amidase CwlA
MILRQDYLPESCKARPGTKFSKITSITIHWIGAFPGQQCADPRDWWIKSGGPAAAHFIVKDELVLATIPMDEIAFHCGVPEGNNSSIGIEVIPANVEGRFSEKSIETLKELLNDMPKVPLKRHYDWSGKDCPLFYTPFVPHGNERWKQLVNELEREIENAN